MSTATSGCNALHIHIELTDQPDVVRLRASLTPNPEKAPGTLMHREAMGALLVWLMEALQAGEIESTGSVSQCAIARCMAGLRRPWSWLPSMLNNRQPEINDE